MHGGTCTHLILLLRCCISVETVGITTLLKLDIAIRSRSHHAEEVAGIAPVLLVVAAVALSFSFPVGLRVPEILRRGIWLGRL